MGEPRLTVVDDRYINYGDHWVVSVVADPDATVEKTLAMRVALAAAVRDADRVSTLRRLAYELAHGNRPQLFEGRLHWYSPERAETCGSPLGEYGLSELPDDHEGEHAGAPYTLEPHNLNGPLTDAEVAEWEALEAGE